MNANSTEFVNRLKEDLAFAQKTMQQTSKEGIVAVAAEAGISLTLEDIEEINEALKQEKMSALDVNKPAHQLIIKMLEDNGFAENIMTQTEVEGALEVAGGAGVHLTPEDLQEANELMRAMMGITPSTVSQGELSEEDLEQVAGGIAFSSITEAITISAVATIMTTIGSAMTAVATITLTAGSISMGRAIYDVIKGNE